MSIICPFCKNNFSSDNHQLICLGCKKIYKIKSGIPIFNEDTNYYGEMEQVEMKELLKDLELVDWKKVLYDRIYKKKTNDSYWLHKIITDNTRSDYNFLVPMTNASEVLDIGAGWGQSTIPLSRKVKHVTALDGTLERLMFINQRAKQEKLNNIDYVCANVLNLPFVDEKFDFVTMMGVLEWVGESVLSGDPRELQIQALKEIFRVMKKDGQLILGIECSHGYKYQFGAPDDHTAISNISYLNRDEANKLSQEKRGKDYRTYTYTMEGYKELFFEAGFSDKQLEFYYPVPDYKITSGFIPLNNLNALKFYREQLDFPDEQIDKQVKNKELQALSEKNNFEILNSVASYIIIAKK